jgi:drug/metabolite transporter (DMT)-like permease
MTAMSFVLLGVWLLAMERPGLAGIWNHKRLCVILGVTSALGTIGWFFASALNNAAYVAAVAQVQIVFTLALSRYWFNEPIRRIELIGIAVILAGVILFRMV